MEDILKIRLPARIDQLTMVNAQLESFLKGCSESTVFKTKLIVEELLANVCNYAYDGNSGFVELCSNRITFDGRPGLMLTLIDNGTPFNPFQQVDQPDTGASVEDREIGGLGVHLVRTIASHYGYARYDGKNVVSIIILPDEAES